MYFISWFSKSRDFVNFRNFLAGICTSHIKYYNFDNHYLILQDHISWYYTHEITKFSICETQTYSVEQT